MKKILFITLFVVIFSYLFFATENNSQSWRFSDEDAHTVTGYFVKNGARPYKDIFLTHQPLMYITAGIVQKILPTMDTAFEFIKRHRELVYLYSLGWNLIYIYVFGPIFIFFGLFFETIKFNIFGNQFLGEVFAMYPFGLLIGLMARRIINEKKFNNNERIMWGVSTFIAIFSLIPLWPSLLLLNGMYYYFEKKRAQLSFLITCTLSFLLFLYIPLWNYLRYTVYGHVAYFLPMNVVDKYNSIKILTLPFQFIIFPLTAYKFIIGIFVCIVTFFTVFKNKKKSWLFIILTLYLANMRVSDLRELWSGFHLLPWLTALMVISLISIIYSNSKVKKICIYALIGGFFIYLFLPGAPILQKKDVIHEHYMSFTDTTTNTLLLNSVKNSKDRLAAFNVDSYLYWMTGMKPATIQIEYYDWHFGFSEVRNNFETVFLNSPPEFIVDGSGGGMKNLKLYTQDWQDFLRRRYNRLQRFNKPSDIYVLKERASTFTNNDIKEVNNMNFSL